MLRCMAGLPMVIFGDGTQTRDFTYVGDTARGILQAGTCADAVGETINIGQGRETQIGDLAREVAGALNRPDAPVTHDDPRPGDILRLYADVRRAEDLIGYAPTVSLREGLERLRDWYKAQGRSVEDLLAQERVHNWQPA
jgi:UDP-glucose 4-epimerase